MPNVNAKTLAVSVNNNFADTTGNINLPITTDNYIPTIQNTVNLYANNITVLSKNYTTINDTVTVAIKLSLEHVSINTASGFQISMPTGFVTNSTVSLFSGGINNNSVTGVTTELNGNQFIEVKFTSLPSYATTHYNLICSYKKQPAI